MVPHAVAGGGGDAAAALMVTSEMVQALQELTRMGGTRRSHSTFGLVSFQYLYSKQSR